MSKSVLTNTSSVSMLPSSNTANSLSYGIGSGIEIMRISPDVNLLEIKNKNGEKVFSIDENGVIEFLENGYLRKVDSADDISIAFVLAISSLSGFIFKDKDEIIRKIIRNYTNGKIDDILA